MNSLLIKFGRFIFWILWPIWFCYFKIFPTRSRVLVINDNKVLLVKGFLGSDKWALPGGGVKRSEKVAQAATRELEEEVGISVPESRLRLLGHHDHKEFGIYYHAIYYSLELDEKTDIQIRWPEIMVAKWLPLRKLRGRMLDQDAAYALKHYLPISQTKLL